MKSIARISIVGLCVYVIFFLALLLFVPVACSENKPQACHMEFSGGKSSTYFTSLVNFNIKNHLV